MHRLSRKVNKTAVRWLLEVSGREKRHVLALMLLQAVSGGTGALYALLMRGVVDAAQYGQRASFFRYLWLILLMVAFQLGLGALLRHLYALASADMENCFKHRLMRQLLYRDYGAVSAVHSAEWLNRMTNDAVLVADSMVSLVPSLIGLLVQLAAALVMLVILDWRFVVVLVPAGFLMVFLTWLFRRFMKRLHKRVQEKDGALRVFLQERLTAMPILRSFAAEKETETGADRKMAEHKAARMFRNRYSNIFNTGFSGAMRGMYLLGFFWCGYGILQGTVSFGTLTAITQLIGQVQSPFASLSGFLTRFYTMLASAERLMEIEAYPGTEGTEIRSLAEAKDYYERQFAAVELRDVSFTYYPAVEKLEELSKERQPVVLRDLSLSVHKGETVAFTGPSGCGKSTVLKVLMCLYTPDAGERLLRDRAGAEIPLTPEWQRLFAYVPQGNLLMSGTIREVVSFADASRASDDESVWAALDIACADFVRSLEQGLDTRLGEGGNGLSEGQMQRLAIARAVFSRSPILLLDEVTSALDSDTEKRLLENLQHLTDRTVVIVTHRPAALEICDRVFTFSVCQGDGSLDTHGGLRCDGQE